MAFIGAMGICESLQSCVDSTGVKHYCERTHLRNTICFYLELRIKRVADGLDAGLVLWNAFPRCLKPHN